MTRRTVAFAVVAFAVSVTGRATASGTEEHRALMLAGQIMRTDGKLLRSRDLLAECEQQACDAAADAECGDIRSFCRKALADLSREIPSVRVTVVDERGATLPNATRRIGAAVVNGDEPMLLDPGHHVLRAEYFGRSAVVDFDAVRGGPTRTFTATIDLRQIVSARPVPTSVWALAATSAVGFTAFGILAGVATARASDFASCRPTCEVAERSSYEATTIAADSALGVGVVAALAAGVLWLARPRVERVVHVDRAAGEAR